MSMLSGCQTSSGDVSDSAISGSPLSVDSIIVRRVREDDLLGVAQLLCASFYPPTNVWHWAMPLLKVGIYQDLRSRFMTQSSKHACFVAVQQDAKDDTSVQERLIGTVEVTLKSLWILSKPVPYISNLAVGADYRRQGVAQRLLLTCEPVARAWQGSALYLNVLRTNTAAQRLYSKTGYKPEQTSVWSYFGRSNRLLLRKSL